MPYYGQRPWFYDDDWIQYISDTSSDEGGYHPRDGEVDPVEPPLDPDNYPPNSAPRFEDPTIIMEDPNVEVNCAVEYDNLNLDIDFDEFVEQQFTLTSYSRKQAGVNQQVVGCKLIPTAGSTTYLQNWISLQDETGFAGHGTRMMFPYYWDGVSAKVDPQIKFQVLTNSTTSVGNGKGIMKVQTMGVDDATPVTCFEYDIGAANQTIVQQAINVTVQMSSPVQLASFVKGWNPFRFKVTFYCPSATTYTNGDIQKFIPGWTTGRGVTWVISELYSPMPDGYVFERILQQNWRTKFDIRVVMNGTSTPALTNVIDGGTETTANKSWQNLIGFRAGNTINFDTRITWDIYSVSPDLLVAYWWEIKMNKFPHNCAAGLPPFIASEDVIGPGGQSIKANYWHYAIGGKAPVNPPGGVFKTGTGQGIGAHNSWPMWFADWPDQLNLGIPANNYLYLPYNSKWLIYLKKGSQASDPLTDTT